MEKKVKSQEKDFGTGYAMNTFDELNKILGSRTHNFKSTELKAVRCRFGVEKAFMYVGFPVRIRMIEMVPKGLATLEAFGCLINACNAIRVGLVLAPGGDFAFVAFGEAVNQLSSFAVSSGGHINDHHIMVSYDSFPKDMVHGDDSDQDEPRVQETSTSNMANDKDEPLSLFGL
ncbi:hypothetical protein Tco_0270483 [Tanacetum coccineum]